MIYTIKNESLVVEINNFGAELSSIKKTDDAYEYLWQGEAKYWGRRAPILFPIVGRFIDDTYTVEGKSYHMTQHGFGRDMVFEVCEQKSDYIEFKLTENRDSLEQYPYQFELILSYEIKGTELVVGYRIKNMNVHEMPFSIGAHPAFNWDETLNSKFVFEETALETFLLTSDGICDQKRTVDVKDHKVNIDQALFVNDALILEEVDQVSFVNGNRSVEMKFEGFPYLGLWSKPSGAPFICIEPWYGLADFVGHNGDIMNKKGIQVLSAGKSFKSEYTIKVS